jgi:transcriptional regulator with XRE-family HTH domain
VAQVESGRRTNLRPSTLAGLSRPLGVSIDYLICGTPSAPPMLEHMAFPYHTEDQFLTTIGAILTGGMERSEAQLAVIAAARIELLREHLGSDSERVELVDASVWYKTPVAALEAYRAFVDAKLNRNTTWIRIVGEPIWDGRSDAEARLWTRYESLLNVFFSAYPVSIVCPYDERSVAPELIKLGCVTHPRTLRDGAISINPDYADPGRFSLGPETTMAP